MESYQFLDCGGFRRLERFGRVVVDRPAPAAVFPPALPPDEWRKADLRFDAGEWTGAAPDVWRVRVGDAVMLLRPANGGQVGLFPEHAAVCRLLAEKMPGSAAPAAGTALNLFAHTGLATLFLAARPDVAGTTHVDAARKSVSDARKNADASGLGDKKIRWLVDDVPAFMAREERRENAYSLVLADPPSYGRDRKSGREWRFDRDIAALVRSARRLLRPKDGLFCLTCHSSGLKRDELRRLVLAHFPGGAGVETFDLALFSDSGGNSLPCGIALFAGL